jgi:hypothetical protein
MIDLSKLQGAATELHCLLSEARADGFELKCNAEKKVDLRPGIEKLNQRLDLLNRTLIRYTADILDYSRQE